MYYVFVNAQVIRHMIPSFVHIFKSAFDFPSMWAYGHHFRVEDVDDGHMTQDCKEEVVYNQSSCVSHHD